MPFARASFRLGVLLTSVMGQGAVADVCQDAAPVIERIVAEHGYVCTFLDRMTGAGFEAVQWRTASDAAAELAWNNFRSKGAVDPEILPGLLATSRTVLETALVDVDNDGQPEPVYRATLIERDKTCGSGREPMVRHSIFFEPNAAPRMRRLGRHNIGDFADLIRYRGATFVVVEGSLGATFHKAGGRDPDDDAVDLTRVCSVGSGQAREFTF
jgi:hypothetical protein